MKPPSNVKTPAQYTRLTPRRSCEDDRDGARTPLLARNRRDQLANRIVVAGALAIAACNTDGAHKAWGRREGRGRGVHSERRATKPVEPGERALDDPGEHAKAYGRLAGSSS
jgi:hypothetical protein